MMRHATKLTRIDGKMYGLSYIFSIFSIWEMYGNLMKCPENSGKFTKNMSQVAGGKLVAYQNMPLFGQLMHQDLKAPMASCHRRRDDGHHPSAEFSEWL